MTALEAARICTPIFLVLFFKLFVNLAFQTEIIEINDCFVSVYKLAVIDDKDTKSRILSDKSNSNLKTKEGAHVYTFSYTCVCIQDES